MHIHWLVAKNNNISPKAVLISFQFFYKTILFKFYATYSEIYILHILLYDNLVVIQTILLCTYITIL